MATDYNKLKVVDLRAELKSRGLPTNGLKAELVARLEDAESGSPNDDDAADPTDPTDPTDPADEADPPPTTDNQEAVPLTQDKPSGLQEAVVQPENEAVVNDSPLDDVQDNAPAVSEAPVSNGDSAVAASEAPESTVQDSEPLSTTVHSTESTVADYADPAEDSQDSQKRRRRSTTPVPDADEIARKRAKIEAGEELSTAVDVEDLPVAKEEMVQQPETNEVEMADNNQSIVEEAATTNADAGQLQDDKPENNQGDFQNGEQGDLLMPDHQGLVQDQPSPVRSEQQSDTHMEDDEPLLPAADAERDVEPSIHPATAALYIKNFMRPLRPQQVQDYLVQLATPAGQDLDDRSIVDFYLDNIRTHTLVVFNTTSAASRVRTALHGTVWPEESTRKPLWVDYFPPELFDEWVDAESAGRGGRGSFNRFEVIYDEDRDGTVTVRLEEGGAAPPTAKEPPSQTSERKMSIPTGPRGMSGIEGAPLGPRGFQSGGRGPPMQSGRLNERAGLPSTTRAFPSITYMPVSEEIVARRLAAIADAKTKDNDRDFGKDYRRYFFERGDMLVDRGPEIFLGIRPPHRERERRRGGGGGGGGGGDFGGGRPDGGRRRRGGGGGRRNNRDGPMPMPHGVPRGGDRYRGAASSGPAFDERGGDRYRGDGYGRY
ncbi:sap domain-containing protein [Apiospora arundinis]|uniref:Sap domain-containing protein n=1 Tax=Apiospora arundinis TaxID=335852 RepID=A0ABR2IST8_9PEZI